MEKALVVFFGPDGLGQVRPAIWTLTAMIWLPGEQEGPKKKTEKRLQHDL
jgi:hypothetical protein